MRGFFLSALLLLALTTVPASAQDDRFTLERTDDGYVRMDHATGRTSLCQERGSQLVCRPAAEERAALEDEIAALQTRLESIEARIAVLEAGAAGTGQALPSEEEFERGLGYMELFFRRFMDIVRDLEPGAAKPEPQAPSDRT